MKHRTNQCHLCNAQATVEFHTTAGQAVWLCSWHLALWTDQRHPRWRIWLDNLRYRWQAWRVRR